MRENAGAGDDSPLNPGVARREVWAWAMYDFANSGYTTVILTAVFSTYFVGVVGGRAPWATLAWTAALSLSYLLIMLTMPSLGARADARAGKRRLLYASTVGCVAATLMLTQAGPGDVWLALAAIVVSNYCYCVGESVVAAFLPELARPSALGRVSGWGWSFGYFGGMLTLGLSLLVVTQAEARGAGAEQFVPWVVVVTCTVFALAALPSFHAARARPAAARPDPGAAHAQAPGLRLARDRTALSRVPPAADVHRLLPGRHLGGDHAGGRLRLGSHGLHHAQIMLLVFTVNIGAAAGAFSFGYVQDRIGHKPALAITLAGWIAMVLVAYAAVTAPVFWVAATLAGLCMGTTQSAGRAMTGALAPAGRLAEFYSLWTFAVQLAAVIGPLTYGLVTWATHGNHRLAILVTGLFFVGGLILLARVDVRSGLARRGA